MAIKLLSFDLDGVLHNSEAAVRETIARVQAEMDLGPSDPIEFNGKNPLWTYGHYWPGCDAQACYDLHDTLLVDSPKHGLAYDGVRETLSELDVDYHLVAISSLETNIAEDVVSRMNVADLFGEHVYGQDTVHGGKPNPGVMRFVCGEFDCKPQEAVHIGDTTNDIIFGHDSGTHIVHAEYGYCKRSDLEIPEGAVVHPLANIRDLPKLLLQIA